jgi:hypothetical protein
MDSLANVNFLTISTGNVNVNEASSTDSDSDLVVTEEVEEGVKKNKRKRRLHKCNVIDCIYCNAKPCGVCVNCINVRCKNKCVKRMCPNLNLKTPVKFKRVGRPKEHLAKVQGSSVCEQCGGVFATKFCLQRHVICFFLQKLTLFIILNLN